MDLEEIQTIAVMGAGNMGHGIAEVAALSGYEVKMRDIKEEFVQNGYDQIEWSLDKLAEKDHIPEDEAEAALERVEPLVDMEAAVEDADFVIEAVPEKMDIKESVYEEIVEYAPDHTVFATNTSSLSITDLSEVTDRPEKFCGMHFFNPPVRMDLVEVISGAHSDEDVLDLTAELAEDLGKTPVRVQKDSPGFIVNRILVPLLNEAAWLVQDGDATIKEVDSTTKYGMGLPMGSFELADQVGIDVSVDVLEYMESVLGEAYAPCPLLVEKVEAETLGKKTGEGFYDYDDGNVDVPTDRVDDDIADRLTAVMANEVAKLVGGDVADPTAIDKAVQLGAGFPTGPAKLADEAGIEHLYEILNSRDEVRYEPADELERMAEAGESFHGSESGDDSGALDLETINLEVKDRVGHIQLARPHRMNTISEELLDDLSVAIDAFEDDDQVRALLITGEGDRAFSAGADVQAMAGSADPLDAVELSRKGQQTFGKLEQVDMPVLIGIDGYALGGGMEMSMCGDMRVASERSEFGQPEHDLGLLPGWGGTQRLMNIVGEGRAKEIIFTADRYEAEKMEAFGFVNEVVPTEEFEDRIWEVARDLAAGPPVAQKYTKRAMLAGRDDTEAGLEVEAQAFGMLYNTDDLMEGITAFMGDGEPEFEGK
ncbi:MAG: 3-hydroxyacyl-CoA dehydrogenase NAD-binding domain-containing protein [Halanaeroarchaeum sp.]